MSAVPDRIVGIIGGLGPEATLDFFSKVLRRTQVSREQDHLHLLIDNHPGVPDRSRSILGTGPSCESLLVTMAERLQAAGAGLIVMPCNTAHAYEPQLRAVLRVPFLSIIDATCDAAMNHAPEARRIGVLAVDGCRAAGLYEATLERRGRIAVTLSAALQSDFMQLVYRVKAGGCDAAVRGAMSRLAHELQVAGAQAIIAACTEVPLVLDADSIEVPLIDSTLCLAERCIEWAGGVLRH